MKTLVVASAVTILGLKWMDTSLEKPLPKVVHDTVTIVHKADTVFHIDTVVSRARDTVKIIVKEVGPLTQLDIIRLMCGRYAYGDSRDGLYLNGWGMVFCPVSPDSLEGKK